MKVERIDLDGDLGVVNSARISFDKWKSELDDSDKGLMGYLKDHKHHSPFFHPQVVCKFRLKASITKILNKFEEIPELFAGIRIVGEYVRFSKYAYDELKKELDYHDIVQKFDEEKILSHFRRNKIDTVAKLAYLSFRIKCPFFVFMQLDRHRVGLAINVISRRYVDKAPEFWQPKGGWRKRAENKKQGSSDDTIKEVYIYADPFETSLRYTGSGLNQLCAEWYNQNIANGMCAEQARAILPLATMTEFVWTGGLNDFARICKLRLDPHAQKETQEVAQMIYDLCEKEYPECWKILMAKN